MGQRSAHRPSADRTGDRAGAHWLLTAALLAGGCGPMEGVPVGRAAEVPPEVVEALDRGQPQTVIALLSSGTEARGLSGEETPDPRAFLERIAVFKGEKDSLFAALPSADLEGLRDYEMLPLLAMELRTLDALARLAAQPEVVRLYADHAHRTTTSESLGIIEQPAAAAGGRTGAGTTVAVLDTGADYRHVDLGACSAPGGSCRVSHALDFAPDDGALDANGHGTNVSSIVAQVAPGAKIAALDVFRADDRGYTSDILAAINWSIAHQAELNIVAMNLSLGGGGSSSACSGDAFASAIASARAAGILAAIAAGNDGYSNRISSPACVPAAVSVGATYDANLGGISYSSCSEGSTAVDQVTCFSNSASFLTLLAPGAMITAGGYTMAGTSQATPHVAGAIAVLRAAFPGESLDATVTRLTTTGVGVRDARNRLVKPRLALSAALGLALDSQAPVGTVAIAGELSVTRSSAVDLVLDASDDVAVTQMCISNNNTCSAWVAYAATKRWTLASGDGLKTVRVQFRDAARNLSAPATVTVRRDSTVPRNGTLGATRADAEVDLAWTGYSDAGSGIAGYRVVYAQPNPPGNCNAGTLLYSGSASEYAHTELTNGASYGYRVCAVDQAGNLSSGVTATARPAPEGEGPVGTVLINQDAALTNRASVTLSIEASDASAVSSMCVSAGDRCTAWVAYATTRTFSLPGAAGQKTVKVWFRDEWGNVSAEPASDTILLDATKPTNGTLVATPDAGQVLLSWSGFSDATTGVAGYKVVFAARAPSSCSSGTVLYEGSDLSVIHAGASSGTLYGYRVCAIDGAGNTSSGASTTARPL